MLPRTVHLFWEGFWLHDNPTLLAVLESSEVIAPVYIPGRKFMLSLGSCLLVIQGEYESVLRDHTQKWDIRPVALDAEVEPFYKVMEANIQHLGSELGVGVLPLLGHSLDDTKRYVSVLQTREVSPGRFVLDLANTIWCLPAVAQELDECATPLLFPFDHIPGTGVPGPEEMMGHFNHFRAIRRAVPRYKITRVSGESGASQHPRVRRGRDDSVIFHLMCLLQAKHHSPPLVLLQGQLLWREFFYTATPNFTRMVGNPTCLQSSWYEDAERLHKWRTGTRYGFLWIDVIMTWLRQEGWIHHLARHAVACFLTRGDLWVSWEEGMEVFEELLLDADYSINAGNWTWQSASAFSHQVECSAPSALGSTKYLPILKNFPSKYIYEPWTASEEEQKQAGCIKPSARRGRARYQLWALGSRTSLLWVTSSMCCSSSYCSNGKPEVEQRPFSSGCSCGVGASLCLLGERPPKSQTSSTFRPSMSGVSFGPLTPKRPLNDSSVSREGQRSWCRVWSPGLMGSG
uniref:Cryptochrome/DNA photolyase FAD-binding domain-containing protein n=1 Tax=Otus sunia TaxID=257818 RepID=A0A8C8BPB8_9STRI